MGERKGMVVQPRMPIEAAGAVSGGFGKELLLPAAMGHVPYEAPFA